MMRPPLFALGIAAILCLPSAAAAQRRMPHQDASALGAEGAVFMPKQGDMSTGPDFGGFYEHYLSARDSLRVAGEWFNPKREVEQSDSVRQIRLGADLIHNWEGGKIHPFVGAGLGAYFLHQRDNGHDFGDGATKFGGTILGGVEFFTSKTFAVKGEARYHLVTKWNGYDPSGLALTIGAKAYF
jgi:Outer membrane protein beta-barrel domain